LRFETENETRNLKFETETRYLRFETDNSKFVDFSDIFEKNVVISGDSGTRAQPELSITLYIVERELRTLYICATTHFTD